MAETRQLTNAILKGLLTDTVCYRGGRDFDTYLSPGHTSVNAENWTGFPSRAYRYGVLVCMGNAGFFAQIYLPHQYVKLYWRVYYKPHNSQTGTWTAWRVIESTSQ